jgi:hypothetical protein
MDKYDDRKHRVALYMMSDGDRMFINDIVGECSEAVEVQVEGGVFPRLIMKHDIQMMAVIARPTYRVTNNGDE